ncbi:MAG: SDR family NAD(P)-dependent oxidoreductase [Roseovarius sp.]|nr:SDR family NAD(P)-dependent oxidoreductase [Roseovarius sp.]MCY4208390.1 SDR family NAD(P)-dependent oxidoreductase [Roseovarius sp.]MCY4291242.1 SDR family NAD(P)-dependent oxidoreductase [Roseovarius sp.]MCY4314858.1 SDR family NAD(P)-dependent oxidoreductase [Roseovarius sp.]
MHVVITGANRGIGKSLADRYRDRGNEVTGTSREGNGPILDVADADSHSAFATMLDGKPIDLLICNAGIFKDKKEKLVFGYPTDMWSETFAVNVAGVFLTIQALLPCLQGSRQGKIAIISSRMGSNRQAVGSSYIYRASKAAAINLGSNLAYDLKPLGIAVGVYSPGWVRTDMGGSNAEISVEECAAGLANRFNELNLENTGCFLNWNGKEIGY